MIKSSSIFLVEKNGIIKIAVNQSAILNWTMTKRCWLRHLVKTRSCILLCSIWFAIQLERLWCYLVSKWNSSSDNCLRHLWITSFRKFILYCAEGCQGEISPNNLWLTGHLVKSEVGHLNHDGLRSLINQPRATNCLFNYLYLSPRVQALWMHLGKTLPHKPKYIAVAKANVWTKLS